MNLDVFVVLLFGLLSQVYCDNHIYVDSKCVEEHVGLYYVEDNSNVYYLPMGNFNRKYKLVDLSYEPSFMSYNHGLKSLLFMTDSYFDQINEFNLETQEQFSYILDWSTQRGESQDNKKTFGNEQQIVSDPVTGNVFFIHENNGIYVCDLAKEQCAEVLPPTSNERSDLYLDPTNGTMFWFQGWLKRARMDGQGEQFVVELHMPEHYHKIISISMKAKSNLFHSIIEGRQTFYADCKYFALYNDTGLLLAYHSNGKNETVAKWEPNSKLIMESEPSKEILSLENPCKNLTCDDGVCVNIGNASAKCLRNWPFDVYKYEISKTEVEVTSPKPTNAPCPSSTKTDTTNDTNTDSFFSTLGIVCFIVIVVLFLTFVFNCVDSFKDQQKSETHV